jgi:hypothetical protein
VRIYLNQSEEGMDFYQVVLLSPLQCTVNGSFNVEIRKMLCEFEEVSQRLGEFEEIEISSQSCRGDC